MRKLFILSLLLGFIHLSSFSQTPGNPVIRPKLVVGIVVDQMRWDYLYRFYRLYGQGGFRRMLHEGFTCENTYINYLPSVTAIGHSTIFTGSVPSIHGIAGNEWTDQVTGAQVYCTGDSTVHGIGGGNPADGRMSPRNLLATTITDELKMATQFQSRVVGISLKDRAAILPGGHTANAAFWLDDSTGNFISSSYYMDSLPGAVTAFNRGKNIEKYLQSDWTTVYNQSEYKESDPDDEAYEGRFPGEAAPVFPHKIKSAYARSHGSFRSTPFGNSLTLQFAATILDAYQLGSGEATDFLTINCASTDYVGHLFGPNSVEAEDTYIRLDRDLANFFSLLDEKIGKGKYLVFLTADHGAAHDVGYSKQHRIPADFFVTKDIVASLDQLLQQKFGLQKVIRSAANYQISLDQDKIISAHADYEAVKNSIVEYFNRLPGVSFAVDMDKIGIAPIPEPIRTMIINGYNYKRSGQIQVVFQPSWLDSWAKTGTTHGTWSPYDTHIPLLFMGWDVRPGASAARVNMTDIAPTLATMLHIQTPSGSVGKPITDLLTR